MITSENRTKLESGIIVLDGMGDKLNKEIAFYFSEGRHDDIQMIVMFHKPAQIVKLARMSCVMYIIARMICIIANMTFMV